MVAVGCETEPRLRNDEFFNCAKSVLDAVHADGPDAVASLEDERVELPPSSARTSSSSAPSGTRRTTAKS